MLEERINNRNFWFLKSGNCGISENFLIALRKQKRAGIAELKRKAFLENSRSGEVEEGGVFGVINEYRKASDEEREFLQLVFRIKYSTDSKDLFAALENFKNFVSMYKGNILYRVLDESSIQILVELCFYENIQMQSQILVILSNLLNISPELIPRFLEKNLIGMLLSTLKQHRTSDLTKIALCILKNVLFANPECINILMTEETSEIFNELLTFKSIEIVHSTADILCSLFSSKERFEVKIASKILNIAKSFLVMEGKYALLMLKLFYFSLVNNNEILLKSDHSDLYQYLVKNIDHISEKMSLKIKEILLFLTSISKSYSELLITQSFLSVLEKNLYKNKPSLRLFTFKILTNMLSFKKITRVIIKQEIFKEYILGLDSFNDEIRRSVSLGLYKIVDYQEGEFTERLININAIDKIVSNLKNRDKELVFTLLLTLSRIFEFLSDICPAEKFQSLILHLHEINGIELIEILSVDDNSDISELAQMFDEGFLQ